VRLVPGNRGLELVLPVFRIEVVGGRRQGPIGCCRRYGVRRAGHVDDLGHGAPDVANLAVGLLDNRHELANPVVW
jgi:hypothetical protein